MNEHDSEVMAGLLDEQFYVPTKDIKEADLILLNTCCIREKAESKVLSMLGSLKRLKAAKPDLVVGVCGCMIQQKNIVPKILHAAPFVNLMFGTNNMNKLPDYLAQIAQSGQPVYEIIEEDSSADLKLPAHRAYPFKAFVNIMYGCNNFCTYCIVPYVRGRERSRRREDIVEEVRALAADGVREVMLLGQNVDSYGNDFETPVSFASLLAEIDTIPGIERIRFMTSHPKDFSLELIDVIKNSQHICHALHLPVQSGSDNVLRRMNRKYDRARYLEIVRAMREALPDAAITTDIIVGFPGETEAAYNNLLNFLEEVQLDRVGVFPYSQEENTPAGRMPDQLDEAVKEERAQNLMDIQFEIMFANHQRLIGETRHVLVDDIEDGMLLCRSQSEAPDIDPYVIVPVADVSAYEIGQELDVVISDVHEYDLIGSLV